MTDVPLLLIVGGMLVLLLVAMHQVLRPDTLLSRDAVWARDMIGMLAIVSVLLGLIALLH